MLIECLLKLRKTPRNVTVFKKTYQFKEYVASPGRYIADVADEQAIAALLKTGAYAEFTDVLAPATLNAGGPPRPPSEADLQAQRDAADAADRQLAAERDAEAARLAAEKQQAAAAGDTEDAGNGAQQSDAAVVVDKAVGAVVPPDAATLAKANELLAGTPQAIKKTVGTGPTEDHPESVVAAALELEGKSDRPRPTVIEVLQKALG